jgi:ferredoxin-type protein NapF
MVYKAVGKKVSKTEVEEVSVADESRRDFLRGGVVLGAGLTGLAFVTKDNSTQMRGSGNVKSGTLDKKLNPVTPPGSVGREHFTDRCTACQLCVASCTTQVLQPSSLEYGFLGMNQPRMDYSKSYCNFDCVKCGEVCPTGAILPLKPEDKQLTQIGVAKFIEERCIVYKDGTDCGACSEHCPTKAVNMMPYKKGLFIPVVTAKQCIGCGACEHACPASPQKAIYVTGALKHGRAVKAEEKHINEKGTKSSDDFPF